MKTILFLLFFSTNLLFARDIPELKTINDQANILDPDTKEGFSSRIRKIAEKGHMQMSILIIPSLEGEEIESYAIKVADKWKLGTKEKDNGVIILFAVKEKIARIEVGQGLEGNITDVEASRILRSKVEFLEAGRYDHAINFMIDELEALSEKDIIKEISVEKNNEEKPMSIWEKLFAFIILLTLIYSIIFGKKVKKSKNDGLPNGGSWSNSYSKSSKKDSDDDYNGDGGGFSGGGSSQRW